MWSMLTMTKGDFTDLVVPRTFEQVKQIDSINNVDQADVSFN